MGFKRGLNGGKLLNRGHR